MDARDPTRPPPRNREQILELITEMAKTPGKYGVKLMPWEQKALRVWGRFMKALWAKEQTRPEDAGPLAG